MCVSVHLTKLLGSLQSKYDYQPKAGTIKYETVNAAAATGQGLGAGLGLGLGLGSGLGPGSGLGIGSKPPPSTSSSSSPPSSSVSVKGLAQVPMPSPACTHVCNSLREAVTAVRTQQAQLQGVYMQVTPPPPLLVAHTYNPHPHACLLSPTDSD